jgi:2-octaprenyl-6-methoxyphenol hydroxylase
VVNPVIIVGGGPVGSVLALALQQNNVPFTMLEARAKGASHNDKRALALSYGSRLIFEKLGVKSLPGLVRITDIAGFKPSGRVQ